MSNPFYKQWEECSYKISGGWDYSVLSITDLTQRKALQYLTGSWLKQHGDSIAKVSPLSTAGVWSGTPPHGCHLAPPPSG